MNSHRMHTFITPLVAAILALLLASCVSTGPSNTVVNQVARYVDVTGEGVVKAIPDQFDLHATAWSQGKEVAKLKQDVDRQVTAILDAARTLGIDENNIQAMHVQMSPTYEYQPKRHLTGYQVSRRITLQATGIEQYATLMDALTQAGINQLQPGGSSFSERKVLEHEALQKAVADARQKAAILAEAAGATLGKTITIQESGSSMPAPVMLKQAAYAMESADAAGRGGYAAGELELTQRVSIRFELE